MFFIANSILHDAMLSENAVHEAFVAMIEQIEKFSQKSCPETRGLIDSIVRHKSLNIAKREGRSVPVEDFGIDQLDSSVSAEELVVNQDTYERLVALIHTMDEKYVSVLLLRYEYGFSPRETAKYLGITEEAAPSKSSKS
jgi:RNA polymerase sigma-70 factor (ECF subfamily)